jgi:Tol biopolymer transport system component
VLIYQAAGRPTRQLVWCDRSGRPLSAVPEAGEYGPPRISPDGSSIVVGKLQPSGDAADLWIVHPDHSASPLTSTPSHEGCPVWSPDGSRVAYFSTEQQGVDVYARAADGSAPVLLSKDPFAKYPSDWSPDGHYILFSSVAGSNKSDLWVLSAADKRAVALTRTPHGEGWGVFSPDGNWIAFQSDESGRVEVYVQQFRLEAVAAHPKYQVSAGGGGLPHWRRDGRELFYMTSGGRLMATAVRAGNGALEFDPPTVLFQTRPLPKTWNLYDVSPDGQKFLVNVPLEWSNAAPITVVPNWSARLKP